MKIEARGLPVAVHNGSLENSPFGRAKSTAEQRRSSYLVYLFDEQVLFSWKKYFLPGTLKLKVGGGGGRVGGKTDKIFGCECQLILETVRKMQERVKRKAKAVTRAILFFLKVKYG